MHQVSREEFEALIDSAVASLPEAFRARIDNVSFQVEDWASGADLRATGTEVGGTLLGVYRGIPMTHRTTGYNLVTPDVIVLFQAPLQRIAHNSDDLARLVERTVRHEIAHYFGIGDQRLHELGAY